MNPIVHLATVVVCSTTTDPTNHQTVVTTVENKRTPLKPEVEQSPALSVSMKITPPTKSEADLITLVIIDAQ